MKSLDLIWYDCLSLLGKIVIFPFLLFCSGCDDSTHSSVTDPIKNEPRTLESPSVSDARHLGDLTVDEAKREIEKCVASAATTYEGWQSGREIIKEFCRNGRDEEAWELIVPEYGDNYKRLIINGQCFYKDSPQMKPDFFLRGLSHSCRFFSNRMKRPVAAFRPGAAFSSISSESQ
jgi:hypothetical protein